MQDFAFYNVGCHNAKGPRGPLVLARRSLRRVLRPMFYRLAELFQHLADRLDEHEHRIFAIQVETDELKDRHDELDRRHDEMAKRQDELAEQVHTTAALGWDYVALVRRLATIEDQLAVLTGSAVPAGDAGDGEASILFPGLEKAARKVC